MKNLREDIEKIINKSEIWERMDYLTASKELSETIAIYIEANYERKAASALTKRIFLDAYRIATGKEKKK